MERRLGTVIDGQLSGGQLYTDAFVQRHHARVRAAFAAVTRPTLVRQIVNLHRLQEQLALGMCACHTVCICIRPGICLHRLPFSQVILLVNFEIADFAGMMMSFADDDQMS